MNNLTNCIAKILNVINVLQNNADKIECQDNTCVKPFLGPVTNTLCFNTRPITLYRCDNTPIALEYTDVDGNTQTTNVFRVESVSNDSVGVLLLSENTSGDTTTYTNTNTYATINLGCICAIRCLADTIVDNV